VKAGTLERQEAWNYNKQECSTNTRNMKAEKKSEGYWFHLLRQIKQKRWIK